MKQRHLQGYGSHYYFWDYLLQYNIDFKDKTFLEIGSTRLVDYKNENYWNIFDSSGTFYKNSKEYGFNFTTVDMDENNTKLLKDKYFEINAISQPGEDFTKQYSGKVDFLYIDAFDLEKTTHSDSRKGRYKDVLGVDINKENCWKMHLECCQNLIHKFAPGAIICFDDVFDVITFEGKGKTAVPFLLDNGFVIEYFRKDPGMLILKKEDK